MYNIFIISCLSLILYTGCQNDNNTNLDAQKPLKDPGGGPKAADPLKPTDTPKLSDPAKLTDPTNLSDAAKPTDPVNLSEPAKPLDLPALRINAVVEVEKKTRDETFLAPWRVLKSELAGVTGESVRKKIVSHGVKNFLALDQDDLKLLLEQDWVWTSLLGDLKEELAPQLSPDALNTLVQTLKNSQLRIRVSDLELTLSSLIDLLTLDDPQLLDKLESIVFGARLSSCVGGIIMKKLLAFIVKNKCDRADAIKKALKTAINNRQETAKKSVEDTQAINTDYYSKLTPDKIAEILKKNFRDQQFWGPILASPVYVLKMPLTSIEALFQAVVAEYKTDPLPAQTGEPLVILSRVCRELKPEETIFEEHFRAITDGVQNNPRDLILRVVKNKVQNYLGASKKIFLDKLEALANKRTANAKDVLVTNLKDNKKYQEEARLADLQPATRAFANALEQTSIDDQNDKEEKIAGYVGYANMFALDQLYKKLSRKETGLKLEHNIKQCLAWALAYLSTAQMTISLDLESFWKLISAYPDIMGLGLSPDNLGLLFKKLGNAEERIRRNNLTALLKDVAEKLVKPKEELHEALDIIEKTIINMPDAKLIQAIIIKQRSIPANKLNR